MKIGPHPLLVLATPGTLTFAAGQTVQYITITLLADAPDPNETLLVKLTKATNAKLSTALHTMTIRPTAARRSPKRERGRRRVGAASRAAPGPRPGGTSVRDVAGTLRQPSGPARLTGHTKATRRAPGSPSSGAKPVGPHRG